MVNAPFSFDAVARLPAPQDNVAIATRRLEAGTFVDLPGGAQRLPHTVLEGHRFAVRSIAKGEPLLSWGHPFGFALSTLAPGDYVTNQLMLEGLALRQVEGIRLPERANFSDYLVTFELDERAFKPGPPVERTSTPRTFQGYRRPGRRGVGTRNFIVVIGTTSRTASFARQLVARLQPLARVHPGIDGIVAIAHTEGGGPDQPNNLEEIQRALAGFMVHSNVAAVLAVDYGVEPLTNAMLEAFMRMHRYALDDVPHRFLTLDRGLAAGLAEGERCVRDWLPAAHAAQRTPEPVSALRVALQCGGSDAFSGVSGNPLAGAMVHEIVHQGGIGVLTETDEAMGAEGYLLKNVRDLATARAFLGKLEGFRQKMAWHGLTAESNPSAGNRFRGLYNISLKSLGAVHKKDPRTQLEQVIDYAQPLTEPGFHFMNGPGNDLEGIAGQVGAGCNLFLFVTGNGSITNFPFAPTLKLTTTSRRHQLLIHEMDIDAGRYLEGESMSALAAESVDLLITTASGRKTKGEHAGHSQVSLWRNWRQTDTSKLAALRARIAPDGEPLPTEVMPVTSANPRSESSARVTAFPTVTGWASERIALVLPTSLCATQIARMAAERMNARGMGRDRGISRFVGFTHTEGCGFGGDTMYQLLQRTYRGYLTHPNVAAALLLEHGCEKVPNDIMRRQLEATHVPTSHFGWVSIQLDGGIDKALAKVDAWFAEKFATLPAVPAATTDLRAVNLGLLSAGPVTLATAASFATVALAVLHDGGTVLIPENDPLLADANFRTTFLQNRAPHATLAYGQPLTKPGLHIVATETSHWVENVTGLAGCGAHVVLGVTHDNPQQGHPMIPVIQVAEPSARGRLPGDDIDGFLSGTPADTPMLLERIVSVYERASAPTASAQGFIDFQLTRGLLGLTT